MNKIKLLTWVLFIAVSINTKAQYKNLVLEGGGMKGIAYSGAIQVLDSLGITDKIENIAGTSSGAVNGMLLAIGYSGKQIMEFNLKALFNKYSQVGVPMVSGFLRIKRNYGYYKTERFSADLAKLLEAKGFSENLTFLDLHKMKLTGKKVKDLYVTGTNLTDQKTEVFSYKSYPNMRVLDAVRISFSIPIYFEALFMEPDGSLVERKDAGANTKVMADGGLLANYPFFVFDTLVEQKDGVPAYYKCNPETLGLKLETDSSAEYLAKYSINNYHEFIDAFTQLTSEVLNRRYLTNQHFKQTIFINTQGLDPRVNKIKKKTRLAMIRYGYQSASNFFKGSVL